MSIDVKQDIRLIVTPRFRRLFEARLAGQTAQNAMVYAALITVVAQSDSALYSALLILALTIPSIVLGIPGGTLSDTLPRRLTLTLGYFGRAVIALALFYYEESFFYIFVLMLAHSAIGQVFGPAESATIPAIVRRDQLPAANSLMMLALLLGQVLGMVVMAPIVIKLASPDAVFALSFGLFLVAGYIVGWMAQGFTPEEDRGPPQIGFVAATREGFRILRSNRRAYLALVCLVTAGALSKVVVILLPLYTRDVLQIAPEDTVFVAAPAALGAALGLLVAPVASRFIGAWRVAIGSFYMFSVGLIGLGFVFLVRDFIIHNFDFGISFVEEQVGVASVISVAMLIAIPLGFAFILLSVAARAVMNEEAPQSAQGRVFAVQMSVGDALSLLPLLLVAAVADLLGVRSTLLVCAALSLFAVSYVMVRHRPVSTQ